MGERGCGIACRSKELGSLSAFSTAAKCLQNLECDLRGDMLVGSQGGLVVKSWQTSTVRAGVFECGRVLSHNGSVHSWGGLELEIEEEDEGRGRRIAVRVCPLVCRLFT
jgi:hypothetical protein